MRFRVIDLAPNKYDSDQQWGVIDTGGETGGALMALCYWEAVAKRVAVALEVTPSDPSVSDHEEPF